VYLYQQREELQELNLKFAKMDQPPAKKRVDWGSREARNKRITRHSALFRAEREMEYEYPQFPEDPELNAKVYKHPREQKIKADNYIKSRGV
jgi:hypothetical protein